MNEKILYFALSEKAKLFYGTCVPNAIAQIYKTFRTGTLRHLSPTFSIPVEFIRRAAGPLVSVEDSVLGHNGHTITPTARHPNPEVLESRYCSNVDRT